MSNYNQTITVRTTEGVSIVRKARYASLADRNGIKVLVCDLENGKEHVFIADKVIDYSIK